MPKYLKLAKKSLKELKKLDDVSGIIETIITNDPKADVANVLICAALLEGMLEMAFLKSHFKGSNSFKNELFEHQSGPLHSFGNKIRMGYAIGLYGDPALEGMQIVQQIRNKIAHTRHVLSFKNRSILTATKATDAIWDNHKFQNENAAFDFINATASLAFVVHDAMK